jgi:lipid-A-disaccharide synthase
MADAGANILWPMDRYTVIGFVEILAKIPAHMALLRAMARRFRSERYDLVVLIDYPGFHLRVAEAAKAAGLPVLYYVAPQLWAWRPERAKRFKRAVDRFAVIFPFEAPFFRGLGLEAEYVGHPLVEAGARLSRAEARAALGIAPDARVIGLFPGSRPQEIGRHWAPFRDAVRSLIATGHADQGVVAAIPRGDYPDPGDLVLARTDPSTVLAAVDAVIAKSGTTTLEAALTNTPMVVAYRVHRLTGWFARRVMRVNWISLVNLIAEAPVVEELVQDDVTAERLARAVRPLLDRGRSETQAQLAGLARVRELLGGAGAAERVAAMAGTLVR